MVALIQAEGVICRTGKTSAALSYARRSSKYAQVFWIDATDKNTLEKSLKDIQQELPSIKNEEFKSFLETNPGYLVIFDNAPSLNLIADYLPSFDQLKGHILITSRERKWPSKIIKIEVGVFTEEEAVECLERMTGRYDEKREARELVRGVEYVPALVCKLGESIKSHSGSLKGELECTSERHGRNNRCLSEKSNFSLSSVCCGRFQEIDFLDDVLSRGQIPFIQGEEGIGKTTLALYYAYLNVSKYTILGYVSCRSIEAMEASYKEIAQKHRITIEINDDLFEQVNSTLIRNSYLLILDDIEDMDLVKSRLPNGKGNIILIGKHDSDRQFASLKLGPLSSSKALSLLKEVSKKTEQEIAAFDSFLKAPPLFLTIIANFLREGVTITPDLLKGSHHLLHNLILNLDSLETIYSFIQKKQEARRGLGTLPLAIPLFKLLCCNEEPIVSRSLLATFLEERYAIEKERSAQVVGLLLPILKDFFPVKISTHSVQLHPLIKNTIKIFLNPSEIRDFEKWITSKNI
ncbi:hypothetical protein [Neochlamydia sp. AcF95]|uniref:hypothetical protein n=1 Tax=Neochlamydia sp. AcF95 TaxID=2795734 RepID=UPI001BCA59F6|nr:hypothetical protein [Neochlamydia sp. AcF95]